MSTNKTNNEIVLIRGLPGSGKTTMAKMMSGYHHLEADKFLEVDGVYVYEQSKVKAAHDKCIAAAKGLLDKGHNVVVANTFVKCWELKSYIDFGFPFRIIELKNKWPNIHNVPEATIERMAQRWEKLPAEWVN
jgi:predicted kinase